MSRSLERRVRGLITPLTDAVAHPARGRLLREAGLTPNGTFDAQDIFIASYPKSGVTWFQSIITQLIFGVDARLAPFPLQRLIVPDIHTMQFYSRFATPMYFKTHMRPRPEYRRVVYLIRDGRDAIISYWHYLSARRKRPIDLRKLVANKVRTSGGLWHKHVEAWLENPYSADLIVLKYEDLQRDPLPALERFCAFAGVTRSPAQIEAVVAATAFANMQAKEKQEGAFESGWPKDRLFNRRGQIGSYRDEMPEDALAHFMAQAGPTLHKLGYQE